MRRVRVPHCKLGRANFKRVFARSFFGPGRLEISVRAVDLRIDAGKLADAYEQMRRWLDHERCAPLDFDQTADRAGTVYIRVSFVDDDLAEAFEREFAGPDV
jgi:hypothetical protein